MWGTFTSMFLLIFILQVGQLLFPCPQAWATSAAQTPSPPLLADSVLSTESGKSYYPATVASTGTAVYTTSTRYMGETTLKCLVRFVSHPKASEQLAAKSRDAAVRKAGIFLNLQKYCVGEEEEVNEAKGRCFLCFKEIFHQAVQLPAGKPGRGHMGRMETLWDSNEEGELTQVLADLVFAQFVRLIYYILQRVVDAGDGMVPGGDETFAYDLHVLGMKMWPGGWRSFTKEGGSMSRLSWYTSEDINADAWGVSPARSLPRGLAPPHAASHTISVYQLNAFVDFMLHPEHSYLILQEDDFATGSALVANAHDDQLLAFLFQLYHSARKLHAQLSKTVTGEEVLVSKSVEKGLLAQLVSNNLAHSGRRIAGAKLLYAQLTRAAYKLYKRWMEGRRVSGTSKRVENSPNIPSPRPSSNSTSATLQRRFSRRQSKADAQRSEEDLKLELLRKKWMAWLPWTVIDTDSDEELKGDDSEKNSDTEKGPPTTSQATHTNENIDLERIFIIDEDQEQEWEDGQKARKEEDVDCNDDEEEEVKGCGFKCILM